jgi:hypothetical protein
MRARDRDRPRLHRLRDLALEVDVQEPVLQPCALDDNVVGKLKAALKGSLGDALVESSGRIPQGVRDPPG